MATVLFYEKPGRVNNARQKLLLIRRPLMEVNGECRVGFDQDAVDRWIGLASKAPREDLESCPRKRTTACDPGPS